MWEFTLKIIEKLDVKRILVSLFLGTTIILILPNDFFINNAIKETFSGLQVELIVLMFYTLLSYIMFNILESLIVLAKKLIQNYEYNLTKYNENQQIEKDNIMF